MQPRPDRTTPPNRPRPACEDQERRLEGILGIVPMAEHRAADAEDHRAVPRQECGEGQFSHLVVFAAPGREPLQELAIAQTGQRP